MRRCKEDEVVFRLDDSFVNSYKNIPPPWGFGVLSEIVYLRTYSRIKETGENEQWYETVRRVVEGTYRIQERHIKSQQLGWSAARAQRSAREMYDRMFHMKFLPPGRGLWSMGSPLTEDRQLFASLNNCFSGDTEFLTAYGPMKFEEAVGTTVDVINYNGQFVPAKVREFGEQSLNRVVFRPKGQRTNHRLEYRVTPNHSWVLASGERTTSLKVGDTVRSAVLPTKCNEDYKAGFVHGLVFGDGTRHTYYPHRFMIRLCGKKAAYLTYLESSPLWLSTIAYGDDPHVTLISRNRNLKQLPTYETCDYIQGFIRGWMAADAHARPDQLSWCLDTQNTEAADWIIRNAPFAGLTVTGHSLNNSETNYGPRSAPLHRIILREGSVEFIVESIVFDSYQRVYCVEEPKTSTFTLAGGLLTGNCAFVSTADKDDPIKPYCFLMDMSMLGVGVGFDVKGAGSREVRAPGSSSRWIAELIPWRDIYPDLPHSEDTTDWKGDPVAVDYKPVAGRFIIPDTREGWVISLYYLLEGYFFGMPIPEMDYSQLRPEGVPIKGFGGVSSGPFPLQQLHEKIREFLDSRIGQVIDAETITTLMNLIGVCVVSGNVRRTAEIVFGDPNDENYLGLKNYRWNSDAGRYEGPRADRSDYGWTSNNSVFAEVGMDYSRCAELTAVNGEPGYAWLDNMRRFGRMIDPPDDRDRRVAGGNPCLEQSLESYELCCLCENFPHRCEGEADFLRTLKYAYLYAKTVSLCRTHWADTNKVLLRNRRIGCSLSGLQQFVAANGLDTLKRWCEKGYQTVYEWDRVYSEWFCVNQSIKKTSVKPSGTVSLLAGATPGMHWPEDLFCIRRMRLSKTSDLCKALQDAGYHIEPCLGMEETTVVVEIPLSMYMPGLRAAHQVSCWQQVAMAAFLQRYWADNQVSCTVTFDPDLEAGEIKHTLDHFQYHLKGISFLPRLSAGAYAQMPYEGIWEEEYHRLVSNLRPLSFGIVTNEIADIERYCDGASCVISS